MATAIKNNAKYTLADTVDTEFEFPTATKDYFPRPFQEIVVKTDASNSGNVYFSVGEAIDTGANGHEPVGPGETRVFTISNGFKNLHAKGSANNQAFSVNV
jgi:hypothetical protein